MPLRFRIFLLPLLVLGSSLGTAAQDVVSSCEELLSKSEDEFNAGRFYGIPFILGDCMPQFTREQRFRAYLLLSQTYLLIDDQPNAEKSFLELLRADPEFVPNEQTESVDIINLSRKFTSTAIFTPHGKIGSAVNLLREMSDPGLFGAGAETKYYLRPGVTIGGGMEWNVTQRWGVGAEVFFSLKSDKIELRNFFVQDVANRTVRQSWIDLPIYIRYADDVGIIRPFGYVGMAFNWLLGASSEYSYIDRTYAGEDGAGIQSQVSEVTLKSPRLNEKYKYRSLTRSLVVGGGIKYKIGRNYILADLRYMMGMNRLNKEDNQYYDAGGKLLDQQIPGYVFLPPFFRLDNLIVNVGYVHPLYQPRKIKKGGVLSFLWRRKQNE